MTDDIPNDRRLSASESDVSHEVAESERHSRAVLRAVASVRNTPELELDPLYESVDPDVVDGLFDRPAPEDSAENSVTFEYAGCRVTVTRTEVRVRELSDPH